MISVVLYKYVDVWVARTHLRSQAEWLRLIPPTVGTWGRDGQISAACSLASLEEPVSFRVSEVVSKNKV